MSDYSSAKSTSSSSAITEKRPQRSGGCVGIFFHLFDWNRRLAKKKLFSKKLSPPARAKRASKKFGRDEKLPMAKLLLIADENRGGFPNMKNSDCSSANAERTHDMRTPGLVARLMGLESMPSVRRGRPEKASGSEFCRGPEKKTVSGFGVGVVSGDQVDFTAERAQAKMESRPLKLQKTGLFERRPVSRFGAEAMQLKSMLSQSRKQHHPKLSSPVKSPRMGRNTSRLMEAATKILEPGLQATNRAKRALTYGPSLRHLPPGDEVMTEGPVFLTPNQPKQPSYCADSVKSFKGQSSCKSCSNWLDVMDSRPNIEEKLPGFPSSASVLSTSLSNGPVKSRTKPPMVSLEQERYLVFRNQEQTVSHSSEAAIDVGMRSKRNSNMKPQFKEDLDQQRGPSQRIKSQKDAISSGGSKQMVDRRSQDLLVKGRGSSRSKSSNLQNDRDPFAASANGNKDAIGLDQNLASCMRPRMPSKQPGKGKIDVEKNIWNGRYDSLSTSRTPTRKKRPVGSKPHIEGTGRSSSTLRKQRETRGNEIFGNIAGLSASPMNKNCDKSEHLAQDDPKGGRKGANVVSFTFNSPMRHATETTTPKKTMEKTIDQSKCRTASTSLDKRLKSDASKGIPSTQIATRTRGEALGALLEEKLKELTSERDEMGMNNALPGRSAAAILEELICALTAERAFPQEDRENCPMGFSQEDSLSDIAQDPFNDTSLCCERFNTNKKLQAAGKVQGVVSGFSLAGESEQPSPGSVLDACFSNDSCLSEILDGCSGCKLHPGYMECTFDRLELSELDVDISDSANSFNNGKARSGKMKNCLVDAYGAFCSVDPVDIELVRNELTQAWEVFVNAGLLLGTDAQDGDMLLEDFSIFPLLHKLETIFYSEWTSPTSSMGFMEAKDKNQFRRFLFDCVIEFLSLKYGDICDCRLKGWTRLPMLMNDGFLTREVCQEVRRWAALAGNAPEEIIERETSQDLAKTGFEIESLEICDEIEQDLLQDLIDELVLDLGS